MFRDDHQLARAWRGTSRDGTPRTPLCGGAESGPPRSLGALERLRKRRPARGGPLLARDGVQVGRHAVDDCLVSTRGGTPS